MRTLRLSSVTTQQRRMVVRCQATSAPQPKRVVVVGGGWAGFGAAKSLAEAGLDVTLLDAATSPGGVSAGWRTPSGRSVEIGTKGFWWDYPNIYALLRDLEMDWPLTPFLTSGFWGNDGQLITEAPVFSEQARLPTLLGQFFYTNPLFYDLPLVDRLSILPWLFNVINLRATGESYERYDQMSAYELFRLFGVTDAAYEKFLKPTLAVGLFAPPEQLSAAAVLETLEFYALAHQNSFDVCWCKGPISEKIFRPLIERIEGAGAVIRGGRLVTSVIMDDVTGSVRAVVTQNKDTGLEEVYEADAVVLALGVAGMQKLVGATPALAARRDFRAMMNLRAIDCIATKLWFDRKIPTRFPANVLAGFEPDTGATYFNIGELQPDECAGDPGTVISADFYGASELMPLSDDELIAKVRRNIALCEPAFAAAEVIDSAVVRCPRAVTHFSPGSYRHRPSQQTSIPNVFIAGDYVRDLNHGANGLSQERSWVAGLSAANLVMDSLGQGQRAEILPVEAEEGHVVFAKETNAQVMKALNSLGVRLPFL